MLCGPPWGLVIPLCAPQSYFGWPCMCKYSVSSLYNRGGCGGGLQKMHTSLTSFQRKKAHAKNSSPKKTCDKIKRKQI